MDFDPWPFPSYASSPEVVALVLMLLLGLDYLGLVADSFKGKPRITWLWLKQQRYQNGLFIPFLGPGKGGVKLADACIRASHDKLTSGGTSDEVIRYIFRGILLYDQPGILNPTSVIGCPITDCLWILFGTDSPAA